MPNARRRWGPGGLGRAVTPGRITVGVILIAVLVPGAVAAQRVGVGVSPEPYFISVPVEIEVQSEGFERSPEPTCSAPDPSTGTLVLRGISPNIESSVTIINGRINRTERVRFTCHYQFVADSAGVATVGPFTVEQAGTEGRTNALQLDVQAVPLDPRLKLRVRVPDRPVYLGQHIPVEIEWWLEESLSEKIHRFVVRSPLFQREEDFRFIADELADRGEQALHIATAQGDLNLKSTVTRKRDGGKQFLVLTTTRTLIPMKAGVFELSPAQVEVEEVTRWRRDLFGGRVAHQTRRLLSRDVARTLRVEEPPTEGRPASYAGAVGQGFSFDAAAGRSVVQRGDPITLTLTVRGDGNLRAVGLPALDGADGLSAQQFRLPDGEFVGSVTGDGKVFELSVRVLDENLREIPALAYSWFDPELGEYQTAYSRPIALSVNPAQVVSADDVVAATPTTDSEATTSSTQTDGQLARRGTPVFDTGDADLAIVRDVDTLLESHSSGRALAWSTHTGALVLVGGAFILRRRRELDPELKRRRRIAAEQRERIRAARALPLRQAAGEMATALRELLAAAPELGNAELDAFLQDCEELIYAPDDGSDDGDSAQFEARALSLLDSVAGELR
jgi:hypothetical protein